MIDQCLGMASKIWMPTILRSFTPCSTEALTSDFDPPATPFDCCDAAIVMIVYAQLQPLPADAANDLLYGLYIALFAGPMIVRSPL